MTSTPYPHDKTRRFINVQWASNYIKTILTLDCTVDPDSMTFEPGTDPNDTIGWESRAHIGGTPSVETAGHPRTILFLKAFSITPDFLDGAGSKYHNGQWQTINGVALSGFNQAQQDFSFGDWVYDGRQFIESILGAAIASADDILSATGGAPTGTTVLLPNGNPLLDDVGNPFFECSSVPFNFKAYSLNGSLGWFYNDFDHDEMVYSTDSESTSFIDLWQNGDIAQNFNVSLSGGSLTHQGLTYEPFAANVSGSDPSITINILFRRPPQA